MPQSAFPITRVKIASYRSFPALDWYDIDPEFNVIVAPNGGGKTALLDAIAVGLAPFPRARAKTAGWNFADWDVRRVRSTDGATMRAAEDVSVEVTGQPLRQIEEAEQVWHSWRITRGTSPNNHTRTGEAAKLVELAESAFEGRRSGSPLPAVAYYGTSRLWANPNLTNRRMGLDVEDGYLDCLDPRVSFSAFEAWVDAISRDRSLDPATGGTAERQWQFLTHVLTATLRPAGLTHFEYSAQMRSLIVSDGEGPYLPARWLSDGTRTLLGLVGDLARRICLLNAGLSFDLSQTQGIVLVDEVDLHLHPAWQQQVVAGLRAAFPRIQWIVTTHSQQVISTVPRHCVWEFQADDAGAVTLVHPDIQTEGEDSATVLADVFGVDSLPATQWREKWNALDEMIDAADDDPRLVKLLGDLAAHFGERHLNLTQWRARRAIRGFR